MNKNIIHVFLITNKYIVSKNLFIEFECINHSRGMFSRSKLRYLNEIVAILFVI
jgi:hypothetical protein